LRRSVQAFILDRMSEKDLSKELTELETYFQDMTARSAAIETYRELGQDPTFRFHIKYLPKLVSLALYYGYALNPKVTRISEDLYKIEVRECFICSGIKSESPVCQLLIGTIVGCCSICYKDHFTCSEVQCKASGDKSCVFHLRRIPK
ncbi:MAG: V4R domain-containing protein, partial [Thermoproteota archaeon]